MKLCSKCHTEKEYTEFNKEASRKDGFYPWCKSCLRDHRRARYIKRPKYFLIHNKVCSFCKEDKPRDQFAVTEARNLKPRCLSCEETVQLETQSGNRRCGCCKQWKPLEGFYKSRRDGHHATCIQCAKDSLPNTYERRRDASLRKHFGISLTQYIELLEFQKYICPVCNLPLSKEKRYSHPVDHAHGGPNAGRVRGIVHDRCNRFILWRHNEGEMLRRAADLVDNPLTDWIVPIEFLKGPKKRRKKRGKRVVKSKS